MSQDHSGKLHTIRSARQWGVDVLAKSALLLSKDVQNLEAEVLLLESLDREEGVRLDRSWLYGHSEEMLSDTAFTSYASMINERALGKPLAYITGRKEFYGYEFHVNEHTLVPRVETELLVTPALEVLESLPEAMFVDIGTGSGCILLSVILELKKRSIKNPSAIHWIGTDTEAEALKIAFRNAQSLGVLAEVNFIRASLLHAMNPERLRKRGFPLVIVSNPPYISYTDPGVDPWVCLFEPDSALFSEEEGFSHAKELIDNFLSICTYWENEAHLFLEIGFDQHNELMSFFKKNAPSNYMAEYFKDAAGIPRVLHFHKTE